MMIRRKTLPSTPQLKGKAAQDGSSVLFGTHWCTLDRHGSARLGICRFAQNQQAATGAVSGLAVAEPGGQRNADGIFRRNIGKVEDDRGKSAGLKEEIGSAQGLIKSRPWPRLWPELSCDVRACIPATDPQQLPEIHAVCRRRFRIQCILYIDPGADTCF